MTEKYDTNLDQSLLNSFKQTLSVCSTELDKVRLSQPLTFEQSNHLDNIYLGLVHMNRLCNTFEYITSHNEVTHYIEVLENSDLSHLTPPPQADREFLDRLDVLCQTRKQLQNIYIQNLLEGLCSKFESTVSNFRPVKISHHTNLKNSLSVFVFKYRFELVALNILYCCLKNSASEISKLDITATENKDYIIFRIKDNNEPLNPEIIKAAFLESIQPNDFSDEVSFNSIIALSLRYAQKVAMEMKAYITYKALKSGNRFDIFIPKLRSLSFDTAQSLVTYVDTHSIYTNVFADMALQRLIDCFESNGEWPL